jgi:polysaccharide export outer membrane protein
MKLLKRNSLWTVVFLVTTVCVRTSWAADDSISRPAPELIPRVDNALYRLGPGDEITVHQENAEQLDDVKARIDDLGYVNLPLIGRLKVSGLTIEEAEAAFAKKLSEYLLRPAPVVSIVEYRSHPVSVLGAVNTPGVIQLAGQKTLVEVLSLAGGVRSDAGSEVEVTRRVSEGPIPVANSTLDQAGEFHTAKINLALLLKGLSPETNIPILPRDIVSVPRAELVYVTGSVKKPGGFALSTNGSISVLQALSLAEGVSPDAAAKNARIVRAGTGDREREEIPVNVAAILAGKESDFDLKPRDILFIPDSRSKKAGMRLAEAALQAATGVAIWRVW